MTVSPDIVAALGPELLGRGLRLWEMPVAEALEAVRGGGFAPSPTDAPAAEASPVEAPLGLPTVETEDREIASDGHAIPVRLYRPVETIPRGILINVHGGGWVAGSIAGDDAHCRALAAAAGCLVISVGYRLAPEHPFPAAIEDCIATIGWAKASLAALGAAGLPIAIRGASAGANIVAGALLRMAEGRAPSPVAFQILLYPACDSRLQTASSIENGEGYFLTTRDLRWYWRQYLGDTDPAHPHASILNSANLSALPPTLIITAQYDPLRDEGREFATRLGAAGVACEHRCYEGAIHGFVTLAPQSAATRRAISDCAAALGKIFH